MGLERVGRHRGGTRHTDHRNRTILSPSTRRLELTLKRDLYAEAGTAAYWVLDPQVPSITTWTLRGGTFEQTGYAAAADSLTAYLPFPVTVCPDDLVR